jgi:hypothetical protein
VAGPSKIKQKIRIWNVEEVLRFIPIYDSLFGKLVQG